MTVAELISVLSELDDTDLVVIGHSDRFTPAADSVYSALVTVAGETINCVVIDMECGS